MLTQKPKIFLVIVGMLFISGCAWGDRRLSLTYTPILTSRAKNNIILKVIPFKDRRITTDTIGYSRNGFGMRCAKVIPRNNVTDWVTDALRQELTNAGYSISNEEIVSNVIEGVIFDIFCDTSFTYDGRANIKVILKKDEKVILEKVYWATETGGINWAATSTSFAKTLEITLQHALKQVVFDINEELLQKENKD